MRRIVILAALAVGLVPAADAPGAVRTYPGCGPTLDACMLAAPAGTTIRLRTNALVDLPDFLNVPKALSLEPAPGFEPRIGRTGTPASLRFSISAASGGVSIRGISFSQVSVTVVYSSGSHRTVFEDNRMSHAGGPGGVGFELSYGGNSRGSVSIRRNAVASTGTALDLSVAGGPVAVVGNVLSSPVVVDSEMGLSLFARGPGIVHTDVASNVIHHVSGCDCGFRTALVVGATGNATLAVGIVNNTVADVGIDPSGPARGILVRSPASANGFVTARVYNNVLAGVFDLGILLEAATRLAVIGDRNNIVRVPGGNDFGSYDMGTTLALEPHFKSAGSYRLSATSPLADAAASCPLGGVVPRGDAAGRFRYSGPGLDLGAYERGSTAKGTAAGVSRTGSNAPNQLVGTNGRDVLCGLGGNDRLTGRGGADFLFAGLGRDRAIGGSGNDRIDLRDGKKGNDFGDGGPGQDVCLRDANDKRTSC